MLERQEEHLISTEEQDKIVNELKAYVTTPISFISTLMKPIYAKPADESLDLIGHLEKLDDEHQNALEAFLKDRINNRHWLSQQTAMNSAVPSTWFGWAAGGICAAFGASIMWPVVIGTAASMGADQLYHQHTIKQRAPVVMEALKIARAKQMRGTNEVGDLLAGFNTPASESQSFGSSLLGIFSQPAKPDEAKVQLVVSTSDTPVNRR